MTNLSVFMFMFMVVLFSGYKVFDTFLKVGSTGHYEDKNPKVINLFMWFTFFITVSTGMGFHAFGLIGLIISPVVFTLIDAVLLFVFMLPKLIHGDDLAMNIQRNSKNNFGDFSFRELTDEEKAIQFACYEETRKRREEAGLEPYPEYNPHEKSEK